MSWSEGTDASLDADAMTERSAGGANGPALYWSARGEVACAKHVPRLGSDRWSQERWAEMSPVVHGRHGIRYQCQHCADSKTPIVHRRPAAPATSNRGSKSTPEPGGVMKTHSILLVDDFEDGLAMYEEYLTYRGFQVIVARSGEEAVDRARLHRPDLILLDLRMPGMTGTEAMRILRADPSFRNTPIIALTAHALDGERRLALHEGFDDLIAKPCLPDALVAAVERILKDRAADPERI